MPQTGPHHVWSEKRQIEPSLTPLLLESQVEKAVGTGVCVELGGRFDSNEMLERRLKAKYLDSGNKS